MMYTPGLWGKLRSLGRRSGRCGAELCGVEDGAESGSAIGGHFHLKLALAQERLCVGSDKRGARMRLNREKPSCDSPVPELVLPSDNAARARGRVVRSRARDAVDPVRSESVPLEPPLAR